MGQHRYDNPAEMQRDYETRARINVFPFVEDNDGALSSIKKPTLAADGCPLKEAWNFNAHKLKQGWTNKMKI